MRNKLTNQLLLSLQKTIEDLERKVAARDEVIKGYERDLGIRESETL